MTYRLKICIPKSLRGLDNVPVTINKKLVVYDILLIGVGGTVFKTLGHCAVKMYMQGQSPKYAGDSEQMRYSVVLGQ